MAAHRRTLRAAFSAHGGQELGTEGDSFFVVFRRAGDAVAAAVEAQQGLSDVGGPEGVVLRVRMGMHTGEPSLSDDGYHGLGVHRAARISAMGHGGQVLLSGATRAVAADELDGGLALRDLGEHQLKDFAEPERIFEVRYPGAPEASPPLKSLAAQPADPPFARRFARARPQRRVVVGLVAVVVLLSTAGIVLALAVLPGTSQDDAIAGLTENTVGRIDPGEGEITAQVAVGDGPDALAVGAGSVWAANSVDGTLTRIDRRDGQVVTTTIPVGDDTSGIAFGEGSLWVTDRQDRTLSQISPETNRVLNTTPVGNGPAAVAVAAGAVWVASEVDRSLKKLDVTSAAASPEEIELGANPTAIAAGRDAIWVASEEAGTVFRIDPRGGVGRGRRSRSAADRSPLRSGRAPSGSPTARTPPSLGSIPRPTRSPTRSRWARGLPRSPPATAPSGSPNGGDATLSRIDPKTRKPTKTIPLKSSPSALAVADGSVWTAVIAPASSHRGGTLRVETRPYFYKRLEPSTYDSDVDQIMSLMYSGLVSYRRSGGATYGTLVGDLATGVPKPSPDGRTYVFRLREGIRYSNGALVKPQDFRASMETLLRGHGKALPPFYHRIVGVQGLRRAAASAATCRRASSPIPAAGTITLHLTEPDTELMHALAFMFAYVAPAEHPFGGKEPPPGTGPYRLVSFQPKRGARLVRNPRFRVWSPDARPDGAADEIVIKVRPMNAHGARVRAVERGQADVAIARRGFGSGLSPSAIRALVTRGAVRVSTDAFPVLEYMFLNVTQPPFDDVHVRRALNYAVDRDRIQEIAGGDNLAEATCQIVPTGFPAYKPSCRYTTRPGASGAWNGPDLPRARRMIERSGTKGMKVTVWTYEEKRAYGAYFASLLRRLGYRSTLRVSKDYGAHRGAVSDPATRAQIGIEGWQRRHRRPLQLRRAVHVRAGQRIVGREPDPLLRSRDRRPGGRRAPRDRHRVQRALAEGLRADRGRSARRAAGQPPRGHGRLQARRQLPAPPDVGHAARPALGALSTPAHPRMHSQGDLRERPAGARRALRLGWSRGPIRGPN